MHRLRRRLTYANVTATLALVIAVAGGTAYAADTIGSSDIINGQVKSPDIGTGQVQSVDVRDDALADGGLGSADIANGQLNDEDITQGTFVNFEAHIGTLSANGCRMDAINGVDAKGDHLLVTPRIDAVRAWTTPMSTTRSMLAGMAPVL